jgi:hypothetical protein
MAAMGLGPWLTLLTGIVLFASVVSGLVTWRELRKGAAAKEQLPVSAAPPAPAGGEPPKA